MNAAIDRVHTMSRRKTGAENPCPPPASAGPLFDQKPPDAAHQLPALPHDCKNVHEAFAVLVKHGVLTAEEVKTFQARALCSFLHGEKEVARG